MYSAAVIVALLAAVNAAPAPTTSAPKPEVLTRRDGISFNGLTSRQVIPVPQGIQKPMSPLYNFVFDFPLPIPPVATPIVSFTDVNGTIDFFENTIKNFTTQTYPNLGPTTRTGYNGTFPGPTFKMTRGRQAVVRVINTLDNPNFISVHLHGSFSRAPWDGWAEDTTLPGQFKDYYYPNGQPARTLWYHDHAVDITHVNAYYGQAGFYELADPTAPPTGVPEGQFDIPLMLTAHQYNSDGSLFNPILETVSLYGDIIEVNGQPWPFLDVEPRKYMFRLLDSSDSRTFSMGLIRDATPDVQETFDVVASDCGYFATAQPTTNLVIAMAQRYHIIIDFSQYIGENLTWNNQFNFQTNPDFVNTDKLLQFRVGTVVTDDTNNGPFLGAVVDDPPPPDSLDHSFTFERQHGMWLINGHGFDDIAQRILAAPQQGMQETWELTNTGGGWSHPIHIHLIDFKVNSRVGGRGVVENYEAAGLQDVVYLGENEQVHVTAKFQPYAGVYMFHCHNLVHEDDDMMGAFNNSMIDLSAFGYPDNATFADPVASIWRARDYPGFTDLVEVQTVLLPMFRSLDAYPNATALDALLEVFYETHTGHDPKPVTPDRKA